MKRRNPKKIYQNNGINSDSGASSKLPEKSMLEGFDVDDAQPSVVYLAVSDSRATKTDQEIDVMRWASRITCEAHVEYMRHCKPGMRESQFVSIF